MTPSTKREIARDLLQELFTDRDRIPIQEIVAVGQTRGVSRRTLTRACVDLNIGTVPNGPFGAFWEKKT